jgi:hypothetical protein
MDNRNGHAQFKLIELDTNTITTNEVLFQVTAIRAVHEALDQGVDRILSETVEMRLGYEHSQCGKTKMFPVSNDIFFTYPGHRKDHTTLQASKEK